MYTNSNFYCIIRQYALKEILLDNKTNTKESVMKEAK